MDTMWLYIYLLNCKKGIVHSIYEAVRKGYKWWAKYPKIIILSFIYYKCVFFYQLILYQPYNSFFYPSVNQTSLNTSYAYHQRTFHQLIFFTIFISLNKARGRGALDPPPIFDKIIFIINICSPFFLEEFFKYFPLFFHQINISIVC